MKFLSCANLEHLERFHSRLYTCRVDVTFWSKILSEFSNTRGSMTINKDVSCKSSIHQVVTYLANLSNLLTYLSISHESFSWRSLVTTKYERHQLLIPAYQKYTLPSIIISTSLMSLLLFYPETLGNKCWQFEFHSLCHIFLPYIMGFDIKSNHQISQTTCSHALRCYFCNCCHHCDVDFVLFHIVACYINPLVSRIHVNTI